MLPEFLNLTDLTLKTFPEDLHPIKPQNLNKNMEINWLNLWRELIIANPHAPNNESMKRYKNHSHRKQHRPDPLLDFILQSVDSNMSVLDIGAGSGRWTIPLAKKAKIVSAVEPSGDMLEKLRS